MKDQDQRVLFCVVLVTTVAIWVTFHLLVSGCATGRGKVGSPDVKIPIASPSADMDASSETTATGEAETSGDVDASGDATVTQTTIGTIQLTSGWLWGPVALLVAVAAQRDRAARWRLGAVRRVADGIKELPILSECILKTAAKHPGGRHSASEARNIVDALERYIEWRNAPPSPWSLWYWTGKDGPERAINKAVRRLKKGKRCQ